MNGVAQLKSLADIRTVIGSHVRSTPRQKGTTYLDVLALGMEQMRLETESAWLARRQGRIDRRLAEVGLAMGKQIEQLQARVPPGTGASGLALGGPPQPAGDASHPGRWRRMPVDY